MNTNIPPIAEKVKFWEEQDKINNAVIPRILEMHSVVSKLAAEFEGIEKKLLSAESRIKEATRKEAESLIHAQSENIRILQGHLSSTQEELNMLHKEVDRLKDEFLEKLSRHVMPLRFRVMLYFAALLSLLAVIGTLMR